MSTAPAAPEVLVITKDNRLFHTLEPDCVRSGLFLTRLGSLAQAINYEIAESVIAVLLDVGPEDKDAVSAIASIKAKHAEIKCIILSSYATIAMAVAVTKAGASDVIPRPGCSEHLLNHILGRNIYNSHALTAMHPDLVQLHHILDFYEACGCNKAETARRLRMHVRTLGRILNRGEAAASDQAQAPAHQRRGSASQASPLHRFYKSPPSGSVSRLPKQVAASDGCQAEASATHRDL
jgi:two-component system response regulator RegA